MIYAPMLASLGGAPLVDQRLVYEPKYDGIRAIVEVSAARGAREPSVHIWSRLGNEKTAQFPEIAAALARWGRRLKAGVVLDGEIVALDARGQPTGFQQLQGRVHLSESTLASSHSRRTTQSAAAVALITFDLLREGSEDLRDLPLRERRRRLEQLVGHTHTQLLRISEQAMGDGRRLYQRALDEGWEGLIAKDASSVYKSGKRTPDWCKLKIVQEQEFVVGGWTEPRQSRAYFGALLLGVYESDALVYVGHTGTGFNERELARVMALLKRLETKECPFRERPRTNERPHWVEPKLVAQVKFTEWTADAKLRHPVYLGLRDDKDPKEVHREKTAHLSATSRERLKSEVSLPRTRKTSRGSRIEKPAAQRARKTRSASGSLVLTASARDLLLQELRTLEDRRGDGTIELPDRRRLSVTNLHKVFWPRLKLTKGDLFRYYVEVAAYILPAVADRPLVMKRYPNGVGAKPFYQHRAADVPEGVRLERVSVAESRAQLIGGDLLTLLYMTQLAAISQDPWFSRVQSPNFADYVAIDLDPSEGVPFARVLDVARWVHEELDALGAVGVPKTSGSRGLHVYIPLPRDTPYEAGMLLAQIIATVVAHKHPAIATVERSVAARGRRVYVDYLQNVLGKTLATAYSARASEYAGVSTPLTWKEVHEGVERQDFTITSIPSRLRDVGDLWAPLRQSKGIDLSRVSAYAERTK